MAYITAPGSWHRAEIAVSGLLFSILGPFAHVLCNKKRKQRSCVPDKSMDAILRPTYFSQIHILKIGDLRTCKTPLGSSQRHKSMFFGSIFGRFDSQSGLCEGQLWHEWVGCGCVSGLQSPEVHHHCSKMKIRWFSTYPKPHTLRNIAKLLANVD